MANCFLTVKTTHCGQIKGETTQKGFEDYIEIESWSLGVNRGMVEQSPKGTGGVSGGASKATLQDVHFMAKVGQESVAFFRCCAEGDNVEEAVLKCLREAAGGRQVYFTMTLKDGVISSVQFQGSGGTGNDIPMVQFSIGYAVVEIEYKPLSTADKTLKAPHRIEFDLRKGK
jgi:type VI secretion system secreted protein Hcp